MDLVLVGLRGCGKSTLGVRLSVLTGRECVEVDELVLGRFDERSVSEVWRVHGETAWREAEVAVCTDLFSDDPERVVAMGGGGPVVPEVRQLLCSLRDAGRIRVLYLQCDPVVLRQRLVSLDNRDRPALTDLDLTDEIRELAQRREPIYRALADFELDVSMLDIEDAAKYVIQHFL